MNILLGFDDVQVAALADPALERARELAARCGANAYSEPGDMLDNERLDAVYVCVPPFGHGALELELIERGLPFFVEKPLATDLTTAETIASAVQAAGLITAVGYHWRYLDTVEEAQGLLSERPARLALGYWLDFTPPPKWWIREQESGGQMMEQTTHIFDLARYLVGEVRAVYAAGSRTRRAAFPDADICDVSTAVLHFTTGALGNLSSTCLLNAPYHIVLHLFSEGSAIELTEFDLSIDTGQGRQLRKAQVNARALADRDFIDAVWGKPNRIRTPYAEALKTHRLTVAATRSANEGCLIEMEHLYV